MTKHDTIMVGVLLAINSFWLVRWLRRKPEELQSGGHLSARLQSDAERSSYLLHLTADTNARECIVTEIAIARILWSIAQPSPPTGFVERVAALEPADDHDDYGIAFTKELNAESVFWSGRLLLLPGASVVLDVRCARLAPLKLRIRYEDQGDRVTSYKYCDVTSP